MERAHVDDPCHLRGGSGKDDGIGQMSLAGGPPRVVRICGQVCRASVDLRRIDLALEVTDDAVIEHAREF
jgi:hypothetical protein